MQKLKNQLLASAKTYLLPILSGILIGTTYIPFFPWALAFCLVPLWIFWHKNQNSYKKLWIGSWITQFILNLIGFHWVAHTASEFGGFPPFVSYIILILFASTAHLYFAFAAIIWSWLSRRTHEKIAWLFIPLCFAFCELINPTIFFWHLGYPWLWIQLPGSHVAEWIGFYGLNLVTLAINLLIVLFVLSRKPKYIFLAAALFASINATGLVLQKRAEQNKNFDQQLHILVVQANIGNAIKVEQEKGAYFHDYILRKFLELTSTGLEKFADTQVIIWPETAFPSRVRSGSSIDRFQNKLRYSINTFNTPLLTGAYEEDEQNHVYNSLVHFNRQGQYVDSYSKTYLLAFGEYFPGAQLYPKLKKWFPMVSDFSRGEGPKTLLLNDQIKVGAQICYESLFDDFSRQLIQQGSQVIVNITNDSWFGKAAEPYQHGYMTLARAIEFRTPLVRSTNTGITMAIEASGKISEKSPLHEEWVGQFTVPYASKPQRTIYSYYAGYWPYIIGLTLILLFLGGRIVKPRKS